MIDFLKLYLEPTRLIILILGVFSSMPLILIASVFPLLLNQNNIPLELITTFAIVKIFYTLKWFWAPFLDQFSIPILRKIGHRKSWLVFFMIMIALIIFLFSSIDDYQNSLRNIYLLTMTLAFFSASLDIVIDAYRIDITPDDKQSAAAVNAVTGYRIGANFVVIYALYMSEIFTWKTSIYSIGFIYLLGVIFVLTLKEPEVKREERDVLNFHDWVIITINPFIDFFKNKGSFLILFTIIFFKMGDAMLNVVATPFYYEIGFTNIEIANINKLFGLAASIVGSYIGGYLTYKIGFFRALLFAAFAQSITNLSFIWLHHEGNDLLAFTITIAIENIAAGIGTGVLVGYISYLCNKKFSASQYALLSAAASLFNNTITTTGGSLVKLLGWDLYFIMTIVLAVPGIIFVILLQHKYGFDKSKR